MPSLTRCRSYGGESTTTMAGTGKSKPSVVEGGAGLPRRTRSWSSGLTSEFRAGAEGRDECADDGGQRERRGFDGSDGRDRPSDDGPRRERQEGKTRGPTDSIAGRGRWDRPPLPPKRKDKRKEAKQDSASTESATKWAGKTEKPVDLTGSELVEPALDAVSKPTPKCVDMSRYLTLEESKGSKEDFSSKAAVVADWNSWTEASCPVSIPPDDSRSVGEESTCSVFTECRADGQRRRGPDESDGRDPQSISEIETGHLVRPKSILSVRTQHESLALRTSFKSQLQLGIVPKSVRFDKLSIREYPIIIGDSPSTSRGVPLSIGWEYVPENTVDVDAYEATRVVGGVCQRRRKCKLR